MISSATWSNCSHKLKQKFWRKKKHWTNLGDQLASKWAYLMCIVFILMDKIYEILSRLANPGFYNKKYRSWVQRKETPIGILTIDQTAMPFDSIRTYGKVRHIKWAMWKPLPFLIRSKIHKCLHSPTITMAPTMPANSSLACRTIQDMAKQLLVQFNNFIIFPSFISKQWVFRGFSLSTWDMENCTAMKDAVQLSWLNQEFWWHILQLKTNIQC